MPPLQRESQGHSLQRVNPEDVAEDTGAPSSWGFAATVDGPELGGVASVGEEGIGVVGVIAATVTVELEALREENALLKKQLRKARAEIKRLASDAGQTWRGTENAAATASFENRSGLDGGVADVNVDVGSRSGGGAGRRRGRKSEQTSEERSPRESRSRKKIDIDTARETDAAVEAVTGGGQAMPDLDIPILEDSSEVATWSRPDSKPRPEVGL